MKKIIKHTFCYLLTFVFVLALTACSTSSEHNSEVSINPDVLEHYEAVLQESGEILSENISLRITKENNSFAITLLGLDETNRTIETYEIRGDLYDDILASIKSDSFFDSNYDITLSDNIITGTRLAE